MMALSWNEEWNKLEVQSTAYLQSLGKTACLFGYILVHFFTDMLYKDIVDSTL
jgi:hypothetical protein